MKITGKIIDGLIARDENTLISFYKEYATPLANYIFNYVSNKQEAIDLAYDLLVDLPDLVNKFYHSIESERGFTRWLYIVARNRAVNYAIKNSKVEYVESLEENDAFSFVEEVVRFQIEDLQMIMKKELYQVLVLRYLYGGEKGFVRWLYRVARNKTINYLKHNSKMEVFDPSEVPHIPSFTDENIIFEIEDLQNVMPLELYSVLYLKYVYDYRVSEIQKALNLTENQVKKRLVKAREIARVFIEKIYKLK